MLLPIRARTRCKLGLNHRGAIPVVCNPIPPFFFLSPRRLMRLPRTGPFPQIAHFKDISCSPVKRANYKGTRFNLTSLKSPNTTKIGSDVCGLFVFLTPKGAQRTVDSDGNSSLDSDFDPDTGNDRYHERRREMLIAPYRSKMPQMTTIQNLTACEKSLTNSSNRRTCCTRSHRVRTCPFCT